MALMPSLWMTIMCHPCAANLKTDFQWDCCALRTLQHHFYPFIIIIFHIPKTLLHLHQCTIHKQSRHIPDLAQLGHATSAHCHHGIMVQHSPPAPCCQYRLGIKVLCMLKTIVSLYTREPCVAPSSASNILFPVFCTINTKPCIDYLFAQWVWLVNKTSLV